jgi:bifunctional non-homologous end joining protein LigD
VSKRVDAAYSSARGRSWLKVKCIKRQEFVIGGFTDPAGSRGHIGALLLGQHDEQGKLRYAGKVGTGFSAQSLRELHERLAPLERKSPPFEPPPEGLRKRGVHWLEPELVAEIAFAERTSDGMVRHASFQGLRDDKPAAEITPERPAGKAGKPRAKRQPAAEPASKSKSSRRAAATLPPAIARVRITHPDRVLYPGPGITKADVALYYAQVAPYILPHLTGRPLSLVRCPEGVTKSCFFQKHPTTGVPASVHRVSIREKNQTVPYLMVDDVDGLLGLIQVGALEIHSWGSRAAQLECPDQLVFDLDPDEDLPWQRSIEAAERLRSRLSDLELVPFLKTTGGKGLHIVVPIEPRLDWDAAKAFSRAVVDQLVRAEPSRYLATMSKARRSGKVFLDYFRNGRGATAVCAYSTRAKPDAPVSVPIAWDELTPALRADSFRLRDVPSRLAALARDPWASFDADRRPITPAMRRALGLR